MKLKIVKSRKNKVYIDGAFINTDRLSEMCNIVVRRVHEVLAAPDADTKIREYLMKAKEGIGSEYRTVYHDGCPMWIPLVMKITGLSISTASKRMRVWTQDGDYDKLFRPKDGKRGPRRETIYKQREEKPTPIVTVKPMKKRRSVESIKGAGTWEQVNL